MSIKREGKAAPAQHQIMSGGDSLFQDVVSETTRAASVDDERSAEM